MTNTNSNEINNLPKIDVDKILRVGKVISAEEVIKEITPISWNEDVLTGDYVGKTIIKNCENISNSSIEESHQKIYKK